VKHSETFIHFYRLEPQLVWRWVLNGHLHVACYIYVHPSWWFQLSDSIWDWLAGSLRLGSFMGSTRAGDILTVPSWSLAQNISIYVQDHIEVAVDCVIIYLLPVYLQYLFSIPWLVVSVNKRGVWSLSKGYISGSTSHCPQVKWSQFPPSDHLVVTISDYEPHSEGNWQFQKHLEIPFVSHAFIDTLICPIGLVPFQIAQIFGSHFGSQSNLFVWISHWLAPLHP